MTSYVLVGDVVTLGTRTIILLPVYFQETRENGRRRQRRYKGKKGKYSFLGVEEFPQVMKKKRFNYSGTFYVVFVV